MHDDALLTNRLETLRALLQSLRSDTIVFYEDAGFHERTLRARIHTMLMDRIDIYSVNEDELREQVGRDVALLDAGDVYTALGALHRILPLPALVIHTKAWALAFGPNAARYATALQGGITMATTRLRMGDDFSLSDYRMTQSFSVDPRSAAFAAKLNALGNGKVCCLPSIAVDATHVTTIGLGDAFVGGFLPTFIQEIR